MLIHRIGVQVPFGPKAEEHDMTQTFRKTLLAGAIAALLSTSVFAASEATQDGAQAADTPQAGQQWRAETTTERMVTGESTDPPQTKGQDPQEGTPSEMERPVGYTTEEYERKGTTQQGASSRPADRTSRIQVSDDPLYSRSFDELDGMDVVDSAGESIGKLKGVVLSPDRGSAHGVISSGGFLGMGTRETLVSFSELELLDDQLQINTTEEAFKARSEFQADDYIRLDGDRPIRESIVEASGSKPEYESDQRRDNPAEGKTEREGGTTAPARTNEAK